MTDPSAFEAKLMPERARAQQSIDDFFAKAGQSEVTPQDLSTLRELAREEAEVLDDLDDAETVYRREQGVNFQDLPTQDVEELAAELGLATRKQP